MKKSFLLFFYLSIITFWQPAIAQQKKSVMRIEVKALMDLQRYKLIPLGNKGFIIFYESNEVNKDGKRKWYFGLFDKHLKQKWLKFIPLTDKLKYVGNKQHGNFILLLFKNSDMVKSDYGYYEIVNYHISEDKFTKISGTIPLKSKIISFDFSKDLACLGLDIKDKKADVLFLNLKNGDVTPYHLAPDKNTRLESVTFDNTKNDFIIIAKLFDKNTFLQDSYFKFNRKGEIKETIKIENKNPLYMLNDFVAVFNNDNTELFFGTYSILLSSYLNLKSFNDIKETLAGGVFVLKFLNGKQIFLKFFNFFDFKNIPGTFTNRLYQMGNQKSMNKKTPIASLLNIENPKIIKVNGNYIFSAEAYKAHYHSETNVDYDFYDRPYPYSYEIFDGYEFYDLVIAGFSKTGNYLWDNDFTIKGVLSYNIMRHTMLYNSGNDLIAAYVNNGKIVAQLLDGATDIGRVEEIKIASKYLRDKVVKSSNGKIIHWYDNYYLVYGYQKITNKNVKGQNNRTVFYVNKVAFE